MPVVAQRTRALCWWHQGSLVGFTSFVALLPEYEAAVVVLTNSTALNGSADWIGQLLLEPVLESPERNDYVHLAMESARVALEQAEQLEKMLAMQKEYGTKSRPFRRLQRYLLERRWEFCHPYFGGRRRSQNRISVALFANVLFDSLSP